MKKIEFKDFITLQRGFDLPTKDRVEGNVPVVASTSITGWHNEYKVKPPGITTGRSGSLGQVVYLDQEFWPLNTTLWVKDFKDNLPKYVYYYLKTLHLEDYNSGAGVPTLNRNHLDSIEIEVHSRKNQQKIASILSVFDDLIENNTRRIEILEEMARRIYREWFVHFRYPGHEKDDPSTSSGRRLVDSGTEFGAIPEGWEVRELEEIIEINRGKTITKKTTGNGDIPVVAGGLTPAYTHNKGNTKDPVITISASGANAGYINLYQRKIWASDCSYTDTNTTPHVYFYYLLMKDRQDDIFHLQHGSAQPHVYPKDLNRLKSIDAPVSIIESFDKKINPIFLQIRTLHLQISKLKETRDLLLPKLISGEVGVGEMELSLADE
jgi:type I restriction enzyme S subunit